MEQQVISDGIEIARSLLRKVVNKYNEAYNALDKAVEANSKPSRYGFSGCDKERQEFFRVEEYHRKYADACNTFIARATTCPGNIIVDLKIPSILRRSLCYDGLVLIAAENEKLAKEDLAEIKKKYAVSPHTEPYLGANGEFYRAIDKAAKAEKFSALVRKLSSSYDPQVFSYASTSESYRVVKARASVVVADDLVNYATKTLGLICERSRTSGKPVASEDPSYKYAIANLESAKTGLKNAKLEYEEALKEQDHFRSNGIPHQVYSPMVPKMPEASAEESRKASIGIMKNVLPACHIRRIEVSQKRCILEEIKKNIDNHKESIKKENDRAASISREIVDNYAEFIISHPNSPIEEHIVVVKDDPDVLALFDSYSKLKPGVVMKNMTTNPFIAKDGSLVVPDFNQFNDQGAYFVEKYRDGNGNFKFPAEYNS